MFLKMHGLMSIRGFEMRSYFVNLLVFSNYSFYGTAQRVDQHLPLDLCWQVTAQDGVSRARVADDGMAAHTRRLDCFHGECVCL